MPPIGITDPCFGSISHATFTRRMTEAEADLAIVLDTCAATLEAHNKVKVMFAQARTANRHRFDALRAQLGREVRMAELNLQHAQARAATDLAMQRLLDFARGMA